MYTIWIMLAQHNIPKGKCNKSTRIYRHRCTAIRTRAKPQKMLSTKCATKYSATSIQPPTITLLCSPAERRHPWNWSRKRLISMRPGRSCICEIITHRCWVCEKWCRQTESNASNKVIYSTIAMSATMWRGAHSSYFPHSPISTATNIHWN